MLTQRYKCIVQYDGTHYVGYQVQPNGNSIQTEIFIEKTVYFGFFI